MDQTKLNKMIKEKINKIEYLLNNNKINEQNKSLLTYTKNYLLGVYNSKESDIILQQESIKKILKKISIKISEIESSWLIFYFII